MDRTVKHVCLLAVLFFSLAVLLSVAVGRENSLERSGSDDTSTHKKVTSTLQNVKNRKWKKVADFQRRMVSLPRWIGCDSEKRTEFEFRKRGLSMETNCFSILNRSRPMKADALPHFSYSCLEDWVRLGDSWPTWQSSELSGLE